MNDTYSNNISYLESISEISKNSDNIPLISSDIKLLNLDKITTDLYVNYFKKSIKPSSMDALYVKRNKDKI